MWQCCPLCHHATLLIFKISNEDKYYLFYIQHFYSFKNRQRFVSNQSSQRERQRAGWDIHIGRNTGSLYIPGEIKTERELKSRNLKASSGERFCVEL